MIRNAVKQDAAGIAKVHVDCWRTTYKGLMPDSLLDNLSYEQRQEQWENGIGTPQQILFVAEDENQEIVGFACGSKRESAKEPHAGDLMAIYVLEEHQGKGFGKELTAQIFNRLHELGCQTVYVEVLAENKSKFFYESLGAKLYQEEQMSIMGEDLDVLIYQWKSYDHLLL
ncbi:GNAT family N-acetyltransferase [Alkalicoccobacillus porphyridii]|nr:GNAT family N-acetyltransferase [Alkalicoccobacillus porphyridii]